MRRMRRGGTFSIASSSFSRHVGCLIIRARARHAARRHVTFDLLLMSDVEINSLASFDAARVKDLFMLLPPRLGCSARRLGGTARHGTAAKRLGDSARRRGTAARHCGVLRQLATRDARRLSAAATAARPLGSARRRSAAAALRRGAASTAPPGFVVLICKKKKRKPD
jgi:hypothetical protein